MAKKKINKRFKSPKFLILVGILAALCVVYLVLCLIAGSNDYYSNTTINGIDVSDMSVAEVATALEAQYSKDSENLSLNIKAGDKTYTVNLAENVEFDANGAAQEIADSLHDNFLMRGYRYVFGGEFNAPLTIKDEKVLTQSITDSKVLEYDTKVDTTYTVTDSTIAFTKGKSGEKVDVEDVKEKIINALKNYDLDETIECSLVKSEADAVEMESIYNEISQGALNATLDRENDYAIVESRVGVDFDLDEAKKKMESASEGDTFSIDATITQPTVTTEMLKKYLFRDELGTYTTSVSGTSVRKKNVKLAGDYCDGTILLPGEVFSYNGVVGQRTEARGFGAASAYLNGETVQEVGGGVCQPSSTLYNAVVLANLEITERHPHSYVSGYVPIGRDATVSWGGPDFKFKNNTDYPIKVTSSYKNSRLTMSIVGTDLENITVKFTSERLSSKPYTTIEKEDATLEVGKRKTEVSGYTGATAQSYRKVYKDGVLISSTKEAYSSYKKRDKVVLVGTKPVKPTPTTPTTPTTPETNTPSTETTVPTTPSTDTTVTQ